MSDSGYVQNELLECNRLTSQEGITGNNENPATWTNVLANIYHLKAGDKVSMYSSFISEKGAGAEKTIEIKGQALDVKKEFKYVELKSFENAFSNLPIAQEYEEKTEEIMLRDDEANIILNYYTNVNGTGYVGLPRAFASYYNNASHDTPTFDVWSNDDSANTGWLAKSGYTYFSVKGDTYWDAGSGEIEKIKNDNQKFTLFMVDATKLGGYNDDIVNENSTVPAPQDAWTIAPEWRQYYLYREKHTISIPKGFNSAQFIADDITRQLQKIQKETPIIFREDDTKIEPENNGADSVISKTLSTTTYKPFTCAIPQLYSETNYDQAAISVASPYYNNYQTIAIKRAEIYETGCKINIRMGFDVENEFVSVDERLAGAWVQEEYNPTTDYETGLVLSMEYNTTNLLLLKDFINSQELYPEIWDSFDDINHAPQTYSFAYSGYNYNQTVENTRFFHINKCPNASQIEIDPDGQTDAWIAQHSSLGTSQYIEPWNPVPVPPAVRTTQPYRYSQFLLTYYNSEYRDTYFDNPRKGSNTLTYGCFGKKTLTINDGDGNPVDKDFVTIYPDNADTNLATNADVIIDNVLEVYRKVGFDMHWSALTTCAAVLFNGKAIYPNYYGLTANSQFTFKEYNVASPPLIMGAAVMADYYRQRYVGADNPTLGWDGTHFYLSDLHTPENMGNRMPNGARITTTAYTSGVGLEPAKGFQTSDANSEPTDIVYKINPQQDINEFCPALLPYVMPINWFNPDPANEFLYPFNRNYEAYTIYDSLCGIFIEDFGYDEDTWDSGLWGLLGFTYDQVHSTTNNRNSRVNNLNVTDLKYTTTNAEVVGSDTKAWITNDNSVSLYTDNIPSPMMIYSYDGDGAYNGDDGVADICHFPQIVQKTSSVKIPAIKYPTSMIKGYYTIRSDIVPDSIFVGGKSNITNMPIVAMVDKMNPQSDYYFGSESSVTFTILKPTRLSSITVSINDPDGSYANVNNSSAIIFKVQRQMNTSFNIAQQILEADKGKKPKL
jgi:hypothetical protein